MGGGHGPLLKYPFSMGNLQGWLAWVGIAFVPAAASAQGFGPAAERPPSMPTANAPAPTEIVAAPIQMTTADPRLLPNLQLSAQSQRGQGTVFIPVCTGQCGIAADPQARYRVDGQWIAPSGTFMLPAQHEPILWQLNVEPHSSYKQRRDVLLTLFGIIFTSIGIGTISASATAAPYMCDGSGGPLIPPVCTGTQPGQRNAMYGLGSLALAAGGLMAGFGIYGLIVNKTKVHVRAVRYSAPATFRASDY